MKKIIVFIVFLVSIFSFAQEIKLKKGDVLVDGNPWIKYQDCGTFDSTCSLLNNVKEELIFLKFITIPGGEPKVPANPQGNLIYVEVVFIGQKQKIELQKRQKDIIEIIYNSKVINADGTLNPEKVDRLVEKYGTPFSERINNNNSKTIIINNNNETPKRSGININIGG